MLRRPQRRRAGPLAWVGRGAGASPGPCASLGVPETVVGAPFRVQTGQARAFTGNAALCLHSQAGPPRGCGFHPAYI